MNRLEEIEIKLKIINAVIDNKIKKWDKKKLAEYKKLDKFEQENFDVFKSWNDFKAYMNEVWNIRNELNREKRMIMPYELSELPDYGDVMPLSDFIDRVKSGGFIDYDGSGDYVKDGKISNITIYPSDVKHNSIRNDFDTIIWFNK